MSELKDVQHGQPVRGLTVMLSGISEKKTKNGQTYMVATARDEHGNSIPVKRWNTAPEKIADWASHSLFVITGTGDDYQGQLSVVLEQADPLIDAPPEVIKNFLPKTAKNVEKLWETLSAVMKKRLHPMSFLQRAYAKIVANEPFVQNFKDWPAATSNHHAYIGGLLEHTMTLVMQADKILPAYPELDAEVVVFALFIHDWGKIEELSYAKGFAYTDHGQLTGHLYGGSLKWRKFADELLHSIYEDTGGDELLCADEDSAVIAAVEHIILSHHGNPDWGAVKKPMTPEAVFVHHLDLLDAHVVSAVRNADRANWKPGAPVWGGDWKEKIYRPSPRQIGAIHPNKQEAH